MAEENLNDLSQEIKGTTTGTFYHRETIKVFVDSRESNEGAPIIKRKRGLKPQVGNTAVKWYEISGKIIAIMVGPREPNFHLKNRVLNWAQIKKNNGIEIEVSDVASFMKTYLEGLTNQKKVYKFGTLVVGHDMREGLQIFRVYIVHKEVRKQQTHMLACFGSGAVYASHRMLKDYFFNFSDDEARMFAHQILFDASYYDKNTDGNINYLEVTENGYESKEGVQALQEYSNFYNHYDEDCTLFLIYGDKHRLIASDELIYLFRKHGDIIVSHMVDHRATQVEGFYFHRLVFVSKKEAEKAWTYVTSQRGPGGYKSSSTILSHLSERIEWNNRRLCVEKASKQLLDFILSNSNMVLDVISPQHN